MGNVKTMTVNYPTRSVVIVYVKSLVGGGVDYDGWYGMQCVDLPAHLMQKYWDFTPYGNAIDYMGNAIPEGFQRFWGYEGIQAGDIPIWKWGDWDIYGHIGFCTAVSSTGITTVEQNVDGTPVGVGGPARVLTRNFDSIVGYLRPVYAEDSEGDIQVAEHNWTRVPERGTFTSTIDDRIYIRHDKPSRDAEYATKDGEVVWYEKGQSVNYDSYVINEGYVWISYIGESGRRNYIATGEWNGMQRSSTWGEFR